MAADRNEKLRDRSVVLRATLIELRRRDGIASQGSPVVHPVRPTDLVQRREALPSSSRLKTTRVADRSASPGAREGRSARGQDTRPPRYAKRKSDVDGFHALAVRYEDIRRMERCTKLRRENDR